MTIIRSHFKYGLDTHGMTKLEWNLNFVLQSLWISLKLRDFSESQGLRPIAQKSQFQSQHWDWIRKVSVSILRPTNQKSQSQNWDPLNKSLSLKNEIQLTKSQSQKSNSGLGQVVKLSVLERKCHLKQLICSHLVTNPLFRKHCWCL